MASNPSFDISTGCDLQEVDNAVNQAKREIVNRFDFKNVLVEIEYDRKAPKLTVHTADEYKLEAIWQSLTQRLIARNVPLKNLKRGNIEEASHGSVRQQIDITQSIDGDTARKLSKFIKDNGALLTSP